MGTKLSRRTHVLLTQMMVSADQFKTKIWQNYRHCKVIFRQRQIFTIIFQYNIINTIKQYSRQHHSISSTIDTLLLSVSFKPIFVDFAVVFNMLALSEVLILFIVCQCCVCVVCCLFVCFPFHLYVCFLCRLQYCVCVKFIDVFRIKLSEEPGKNAEKLSVTW